MKTYDYIVIGAGPAGLAFASSVENSNVLVVDLGKAVSDRDRYIPQECVQGAGGAGLFSDGKFSFHPAGTKIWEQDEVRLKAAYHLLKKDLDFLGTVIPIFPNTRFLDNRVSDLTGWILKPYKSIYLSLENRIKLTLTLTKRCPQIFYETEFLEHIPLEEGYFVKLKDIKSGKLYHLQTKKLIFAGGRFMPLFLNCKKRFRRYEFGFRIEGPNSLIQKQVNLTDPKYIFEHAGVEYRTFCWCENGEVVKTTFNEIESFSGRADGKPTEMSNFGFNIRIKLPSLLLESDFQELMKIKPYKIPLKIFLKNLSSYYNSSSSHLIEYGLTKLLDRFKGLYEDEVRVIGPTIEGVGNYPDVDENFELIGSPGIYAIGDCGGTYRGIVPSMLAGYILAVMKNQENLEKMKLLSLCNM